MKGATMKTDSAVKAGSARKTNRAWLFVILAGMLEIVWASGLKYQFVPYLLMVPAILLGFDLFVRAAKRMPIGTAYAVFVGIGTVGTIVVESIISHGGVSFLKGGLILLLLLCIIGLKLTSHKGVNE
jgi:paired small multidrug resistance pump